MALATFDLQLLQASDYDAVRAFIDVSVDAAALPDSLIDLYGPLAESEVIARDANALTYESGVTADAVKWTRVRRATVLLTAARLCGALPVITQERVGSDQYTRQAFDAEKRAAELRGLANAELSAYLTESGQVEPLGSFWLASGSRGR